MSSDDDFLISLLLTVQLRMRHKDTVAFTVVKRAIIMENITKEYTLLAEVVSNLYFQHMRLASETEHKEVSLYTKPQHRLVEAEKLELCTSLFARRWERSVSAQPHAQLNIVVVRAPPRNALDTITHGDVAPVPIFRVVPIDHYCQSLELSRSNDQSCSKALVSGPRGATFASTGYMNYRIVHFLDWNHSQRQLLLHVD
jgi:hypothetical protein